MPKSQTYDIRALAPYGKLAALWLGALSIIGYASWVVFPQTVHAATCCGNGLGCSNPYEECVDIPCYGPIGTHTCAAIC